jgi:hypothetical protein
VLGSCTLNVDSRQERGESPFHGDGEPGAFVGPMPAGMHSVEPVLHTLITKDVQRILQEFWQCCLYWGGW